MAGLDVDKPGHDGASSERLITDGSLAFLSIGAGDRYAVH
jgi:hypothetical protein